MLKLSLKQLFLVVTFILFSTPQFAHAEPQNPPARFHWPVSASEKPDYPLNSTFGPRLRAADYYKYDFHRGIDIMLPDKTPVHATADGTIFRAGDYPQYSDRIVVIRHEIDGQRYHSYYAHLDSVLVKEGDTVRQGDPVALSGVSASGFPHLHFELRKGSNFQKNSLHPLRFLSYPDDGGPKVSITNITRTKDAPSQATVHIELPIDQLDLVRVEMNVTSPDGKSRITHHAYDMEAWNQKFDRKDLDLADFNGITVAPARFNRKTKNYTIDLTFNNLDTTSYQGKLKFTAIAIDARGNRTLFSKVR